MKNRMFVATVLVSAVLLGIVGCQNHSLQEVVNHDDIETTTATVETQEETPTSTSMHSEASISLPQNTDASTPTPTPCITEEPDEVLTEASETMATQAADNSQPETENTTQSTVETTPQVPTSEPISPPVPTATSTPVPTATPTPEPVAIDIDASAQANGYVAIDIDMGNGTTQRIYGYYVDMSGLDSRVNDYRESIGLPRLPTDTEHVSEMQLRAAEATVSPGHWRPNGQIGSEANFTTYVSVDEAYNAFYNSPDGHRQWWEDEYVYSIYSVGFRRMIFDESTGTWSCGSSATVQYFG